MSFRPFRASCTLARGLLCSREWLFNTLEDIIMDIRISQKLAAVAMAVIMNAAIVCGVACLLKEWAISI